MKSLKFRRHLIPDIQDGIKTSTWRLFDDKDLKVGDTVEMVAWETGKIFAYSKIVNIYEKKLEEIGEKDLEGHEKFADREEMLATYKQYYGDRVEWDTPVKIVEFKLM